MKIEGIVVGPLQANCYFIYDEASRDALVIDAGADASRILRFIAERNLRVSNIVCTHGHFDHVGAVAALREKTGAPVVLSREEIEIYSNALDQAATWEYEIDQPPPPDLLVAEGDALSVGAVSFRVLHTPGHSPGSICLYHKGLIITGDTIFAGSVGRTDFYGGSMEELKKSFRMIIDLPPETLIFPGHGEATSVRTERRANFFMYEL